MLEPQCLRWALTDLAQQGEIALLRAEDALYVSERVSGPTLLVSCPDGWKLRLTDGLVLQQPDETDEL